MNEIDQLRLVSLSDRYRIISQPLLDYLDSMAELIGQGVSPDMAAEQVAAIAPSPQTNK